MIGTCAVYHKHRGFGFIKTRGGLRVFVHYRELRACGIKKKPKPGDRFRFDVAEGERGPHAINLTKVD